MSDKVIEGLTKVLANSYVLQLKKQNYHWNVKGLEFFSLHKLFEEQYDEQFEAIDEIAERIRTLGAVTIGSFKEYLEIAEIQEEKSGTVDSKTMLANLVQSEGKLLRIIEETRKLAEEAEDEVTVDLMISRTEQHQKNKWMLESSLG